MSKFLAKSITSVVVSFLTETTEPEVDSSEVLLDLDLTEDLLELLFGVLVEVSSVSFWDSVSHCSGYHKMEKIMLEVCDLEEWYHLIPL